MLSRSSSRTHCPRMRSLRCLVEAAISGEMAHKEGRQFSLRELASSKAKGLKRCGVAVAVDNVLAPLFRELEDDWANLQRSADAEPPTLGATWTKVRAMPSVAGFIAAEAPAAQAPATAARRRPRQRSAG